MHFPLSSGPGSTGASAPPEPGPDGAPAPEGRDPTILACALGTTGPLAQNILETLPRQWLPGWTAVSVAASTDTLLEAAQANGRDWTTLLVTHHLSGDVSLPEVLFQIRRLHPQLRIAVLLDTADSESRQALIGQLSQAGIVNLLAGTVDFPALVQLVTTDLSWSDTIARYLQTVSSAPIPQQRRIVLPPSSPDEASHEPSAERVPVFFVSPNRPVIIAVAGIAAGVGTSCVAAALAERLTALGQETVLCDVNQQTTTFADWRPSLKADVAGPTDHWSSLPARRKWSYIILDCHTDWVGRGIPDAAEIVIEVGPGAAHRWGRWSDWERSLKDQTRTFDRSKSIYVIAPGPQASEIAERLHRREMFQGVPIVQAADVFTSPDSEAWDPILHAVMPAPARRSSKSRLPTMRLPKFLQRSSRT